MGEQAILVTLPNLQLLWLKGASDYLESLIAPIRVPLLCSFGIELFNQNTFVLPHLSHLLNVTERWKQPQAPGQFNFLTIVLP